MQGECPIHPQRKLAEGHAMTHRNGCHVYIAFSARIGKRTLDKRASERIWPIEQEDSRVAFRGGFEEESQDCFVSVKANTCVLQIDDNYVQFLEFVLRWPSLGICRTV